MNHKTVGSFFNALPHVKKARIKDAVTLLDDLTNNMTVVMATPDDDRVLVFAQDIDDIRALVGVLATDVPRAL